MLEYRGRDFSLAYPDNWRVFERDSAGVGAPVSAIHESKRRWWAMARLLVLRAQAIRRGLQQATNELVSVLRSADPGMRIGREALLGNRHGRQAP
jgi:hypothetical protein